MKIQLLILTEDVDYSRHLSQILAENHAGSIEVTTCSSRELLSKTLNDRRYDVALVDAGFTQGGRLDHVHLSLLLWDEMAELTPAEEQLSRVRKYQRISALTEDVLEQYAKIAGRKAVDESERASITVVWSPIGGAGKTTVALAYAAQLVAAGKQTVYLNLESFSSVPVYFQNQGKSISEAFEYLGGNLELMLQSIRRQDPGSGIFYFCAPNNYDDINTLTEEDISALLSAAGRGADALVVDLSTPCDSRCREILTQADTVFLVVDGSQRSQAKWQQFQSQNNVFERIRDKSILVCNMGAQITAPTRGSVVLPYVRSDNPASVYKNLSATNFGV